MYWVTYPFTGCYLVWKNGIAIMGEGCVELPSYTYSSSNPSNRVENYFCTNRNLIINFNIYGQSGFLNSDDTNSVKIANRVELVEMTDNVTYINDYCFNGCVTLEKIKLSNNIPELRGGTFRGCTKLKSVIIGSGTLTINSRVFEKCSALESITIPDSVTKIKSEAFYNCNKLKTAVIGNGIESMSSNSFVACTALELIVINKPQGSVSGAPWGATNATVVWTG